jgi:hypothetical protein
MYVVLEYILINLGRRLIGHNLLGCQTPRPYPFNALDVRCSPASCLAPLTQPPLIAAPLRPDLTARPPLPPDNLLNLLGINPPPR